MFTVRFWFEGSERFIWLSESKSEEMSIKRAKEFANKNCIKWEWGKSGKRDLIRGITTGIPIHILISITRS